MSCCVCKLVETAQSFCRWHTCGGWAATWAWEHGPHCELLPVYRCSNKEAWPWDLRPFVTCHHCNREFHRDNCHTLGKGWRLADLQQARSSSSTAQSKGDTWRNAKPAPRTREAELRKSRVAGSLGYGLLWIILWQRILKATRAFWNAGGSPPCDSAVTSASHQRSQIICCAHSRFCLQTRQSMQRWSEAPTWCSTPLSVEIASRVRGQVPSISLCSVRVISRDFMAPLIACKVQKGWNSSAQLEKNGDSDIGLFRLALIVNLLEALRVATTHRPVSVCEPVLVELIADSEHHEITKTCFSYLCASGLLLVGMVVTCLAMIETSMANGACVGFQSQSASPVFPPGRSDDQNAGTDPLPDWHSGPSIDRLLRVRSLAMYEKSSRMTADDLALPSATQRRIEDLAPALEATVLGWCQGPFGSCVTNSC